MTMTRTVPGRSALYIAAKAPRPGFAKTRLARGVGHRAALGLYRAFLRDLGARFADLPADYALGWYITPPDAWPDLAPLVTPPGARMYPSILAQGEGDWATRQDALFAGAATRGEERTILIASDSPHLSVEIVVAAFRQLDHHDLVLGPVADGGYYLIGMKGWCDVLNGVPMSTGSVLRDLIARARSQGRSVGLVAPTFDIDEASDLDRLRRLAAIRTDLAATYAALRDFGLLGDPYPVPAPAFAEAALAD
jgi:rSAM/selenodomain-associated transferase 1